MHKSITILVLCLFFCLVLSAENPYKGFEDIIAALDKDGYNIVKVAKYKKSRGALAYHRTAVNYETKKPKQLFYLEGNAFEMGYLTGVLAHEDVEITCSKFIDGVLTDFLNGDVGTGRRNFILEIVKTWLKEGVKSVRPDVPQEYIDEMKGMVAGCKKMNLKTEVSVSKLLMVNVGFDCILSRYYTLDFSNIYGIKPEELNAPVMCNDFSVFGNATVDKKHYFGRDFMFPTGGIMEYRLGMTVYNPTDGRLPMVAVNCPGMVGSVTTMNSRGVGMAVDNLPGNNCNPKRVGINSIMMLRHVTHRATSARHAVDIMVDVPRGVSWLYFIADGTNDEAVVVEGGATMDKMDFPAFANQDFMWLQMLPNSTFLNNHENQQHRKGLTFRWNDYKYPQEFLKFNADMFNYFEKREHKNMWSTRGYVNKNYEEKNCPLYYFFPPQRENKDDVLIMTNFSIVPSMRLCGMNPWTVNVYAKRYDDMQWRYDELNVQILDSYGKIDEKKAIEIIDYLAPYKKFPHYYDKIKSSPDGKTKIIKGAVSLCNMTDRVIHSHVGYYADGWIKATLDNYLSKK
ncbi:carcinine hydrolase/isopenicillin-N N-acyltransferase family protein [Candidatus Uabimicrobium sp. HlEnr_7]|uniref:carcinine hydrolase/isopenicillin-N N-acyltransferase family protein n=1 Tax=Candidatus Uabimicrobium helgolandensis TaxID=3095367 RepID=UPI00355680F8